MPASPTRERLQKLLTKVRNIDFITSIIPTVTVITITLAKMLFEGMQSSDSNTCPAPSSWSPLPPFWQ